MKLRLLILGALFGGIVCLGFGTVHPVLASSYEISDGSIYSNYLFDNTTTDSSGNGHDAAWLGGTEVYTTTSTPGSNFIYSLRFDNDTYDHLQCTGTSSVTSVGFWAKLRDAGSPTNFAFPMMISRGDNNGNYFWYISGAVKQYAEAPPGTYNVSYTWTKDTNWHFWVIQNSPGFDESQIWMDGEKKAINANTIYFNPTDGGEYFINQFSPDDTSSGSYVANIEYSNLFFSTVPLATSTIEDIWNDGNGKPVCATVGCSSEPTPTPPPGPENYTVTITSPGASVTTTEPVISMEWSKPSYNFVYPWAQIYQGTSDDPENGTIYLGSYDLLSGATGTYTFQKIHFYLDATYTIVASIGGGTNAYATDTQTFHIASDATPTYPSYDALTPVFQTPFIASPIPTPTGTSTPDEWTLDCSEEPGIGRSVCIVAGFLFLPNQGSLILMTSTQAEIMTKVPFSYLSDLRNRVYALQNNYGSTTTIGTVYITLWGITTTLFSASSFTAFVPQSVRNITIPLMQAGCWISLAIYIWNRTRSWSFEHGESTEG